jgi:hypothetical protein
MGQVKVSLCPYFTGLHFTGFAVLSCQLPYTLTKTLMSYATPTHGDEGQQNLTALLAEAKLIIPWALRDLMI